MNATIVGATDLDGTETCTGGGAGVDVIIKSTPLGNTVVCGTLSDCAPGTTDVNCTVSFSYTAPANGCETGIVAYQTNGNNTNNGCFDDGTGPAGFAYVNAASDNSAIACGSVSTVIHNADHNPLQVLTGVAQATEGIIVHDLATVAGACSGTVDFTFYVDGEGPACGGTATAAGTVSIDSNGVAHPSNSEGPLGVGNYSFKAHYSGGTRCGGGASYPAADSPCEPLKVNPALEEQASLTVCKYNDAKANGAYEPGTPDEPIDTLLDNWELTLSGEGCTANEGQSLTTGAGGTTGCVTWTGLTPGSTCTVTEAAPSGGTPWFNTDPGDSGPCLIQENGCTPQKTTDPLVAGVNGPIYFGNIQSAQKSGQKFYDANANGVNDDEQVVPGFQITLNGTAVTEETLTENACTKDDGNYLFTVLPGTYQVCEVKPTSGTWMQTSPTDPACYDIVLEPGDVDDDNDFGNLCLGSGGGLTLGFWSNKNGQNLITGGQLCTLNGLNLKNALCADFDPILGCASNPQISAGKTALKNWLLSATATNMAYMLSAQLAAMELNVLNGKVGGGSLVYAPGCGNTGVGSDFITISDLITAANSALGDDGCTPAGDPNRSRQECLKNALDKANNNLNFVQSRPCTFTPYCVAE